ncbi:MAG: pseudouridine synthase [Alphaproteobacteria bacterium]|nr:pseudouridine synthase [Alphaproteobacteria bacterium]
MSTVILFNKPFNTLSQFTPEGGHKALNEFNLPPKVYAAGRLDYDSEGALLLTDNGKLIKKLLDPDLNHPRTYLAQVEGQITQEAIQQLENGVIIKGYHTKKCKAKIVSEPENLWDRNPPIRYRANIPTSWIELTLTEGKNRQVRHMTAAVGFPTLRLIRTKIGNIKLENLLPGQWKIVEEKIF